MPVVNRPMTDGNALDLFPAGEEGSLYPALQRLLKAKLVKAEWASLLPIAAPGRIKSPLRV
jgi:hypothetical protein